MTSPFEYYMPWMFGKELSKEESYEMFVESLFYPYDDESEETMEMVEMVEMVEKVKMETVKKVEMMIDDEMIGKVIGRRGDVISKIREDSGASIKIYDRVFKGKRKIKILGRELDVKVARESIMRCIPVY